MKPKQKKSTIHDLIILLHIITSPCFGQIIYDLVQEKCQYNGWYVSFNGTFCTRQCSTLSLLFGGYDGFDTKTLISRTMLLPPHYKVGIRGILEGFIYNNPTGQDISINLDNTQFISQSDSPYSSCNSFYVFKHIFNEQTIQHTSNSLTISIFASQYHGWGIFSLELLVYYCDKGCNSCDNNGGCQRFNRYQEFYLNPLENIDGWIEDSVLYTNKYKLFDNTLNGLEVLQIDLNKNYQKTLFIKQNQNFQYQVSFKIIASNLKSFQVNLYINSQLIFQQNLSGDVIEKQCCDYVYHIQEFKSQFLYASSGLLNLVISVDSENKCDPNCQINLGIRDFELLYNQQILYECDDSNLQPFDGCFQNFYSCSEGCLDCVRGICIRCLIGWYLEKNTQKCIPYCGDNIIIQFEECDDGNSFPYDGCYECKYQCNQNCQKCLQGKCIECKETYSLFDNQCVNSIEGNFKQIQSFLDQGFEYHINLNNQYYQLQNYQEQKCNLIDYTIFGYYYQQCPISIIENCVQNVIETCLECDKGYILDFYKKQCIAKCGDQIKQYEEQCDNYSNTQFSGCYHCQNSCQEQCLECYNSKCLNCKIGWYLKDGICVSECGDGIITEGSYEQCDDGQEIDEIECQGCKIICSPNCKRCQSSNNCLECDDYYKLTIENYCVPICGDQYIVEGIEECDDGNDQEYDGCYNCQYSCRKGCQICEKGVCKSMCLDEGFSYNETFNKCESTCGDGIIAKDEECDDQNNIEFDGCHQCLSSCDEFCVKCFAGKCWQCQEGHPLTNNQCSDQCGNGYKSTQEDCDDGNNVNGDGCSSSCRMEKYWFCFESDQQNICKKKTQILLTFLNQTLNLQYVKLDFTKLIRTEIENTLVKSLDYKLLELSEDSYKISLNEVIELSGSVINSQCVFQIDYLKTITSNPTMSVKLISSDITDEDEISVDVDTTAIILLKPSVTITQEQILTAKNFQQLGKILIYSLVAASGLIFFSGNPSDCLEILDVLQYQSYLRYINIQYPQNLIIYFESSDTVTVSPALEKLKIVEFFDFTIGQVYINSIGKFQHYGINADLLSNIYGQITQIGITIVLLIIIIFYKIFYFKYCFTSRHFYVIVTQKSKTLEMLAFSVYKINKFFFSIEQLLNSDGIRQLFLANSWDLTFKVLLFMASNTSFDLREKVSYIICGIFCLFIILLISTHLKGFTQKIILQKVRLHQHETIILIKRVLFLFVLINLQNNSIYQCLFSTLISLFYIGFIYIVKFTETNLETKIILMTEIPILLFTITSLAFCQDFKSFSTDEQKIVLGFAQISVLVLGLSAPLIKHLYFFLQKLQQSLIKRCQTHQAPKIMTFDNFFTLPQINKGFQQNNKGN